MNYKLCIHEKNEQAIASHKKSLGIIPPPKSGHCQQ